MTLASIAEDKSRQDFNLVLLFLSVYISTNALLPFIFSTSTLYLFSSQLPFLSFTLSV